MRRLGFVEQARESIGAQEVVQIDPTGRYARVSSFLIKFQSEALKDFIFRPLFNF